MLLSPVCPRGIRAQSPYSRLHADYYAREWGFGLAFEAKVAGRDGGIPAAHGPRRRPVPDRLARRRSRRFDHAGCVRAAGGRARICAGSSFPTPRAAEQARGQADRQTRCASPRTRGHERLWLTTVRRPRRGAAALRETRLQVEAGKRRRPMERRRARTAFRESGGALLTRGRPQPVHHRQAGPARGFHYNVTASSSPRGRNKARAPLRQ